MGSPLETLISKLENEIEDADEETFLLYSRPILSQNLGFIDPKAQSIEVTLGGRDIVIHQSPAVLSSTRAGGTTGAVLWKVTPSCAEWLASPNNIFFASGILDASSFVLELGCGISPLNALAVSQRVGRYVLTDQPYVQKLVQQNIDENLGAAASSSSSRKSKSKSKPKHQPPVDGRVHFRTLDWETDQVTPDLTCDDAVGVFDAVIACDCVFNYALIQPFVQTCADLCRLRATDTSENAGVPAPPCVCIVAQQLRNDDVFQSWLAAFSETFRVWRLSDDVLPERLRPDAGFVVHIGILR